MPNYIEMMNTVRANGSAQYQERVPVASQDNFDDVGTSILSYDATKVEFLDAFVFKICLTEVTNRRYKNHLAVLKQNKQPYGGLKEVVHTNPVKAKTFDGSNTSDMLEVNKPDVKTVYFKRNRQDKYPVSISDAQLKDAFTSLSSFAEFHQSVLNAMYSGDEMDEYLFMRHAISEAPKVIIENDFSNPSDLIKAVQTTSRLFKYERSDFAPWNLINKTDIEAGTTKPVYTWCPTEKQVLLIREDIDVETDVEVLAKAMNMNKTDFIQRKIGVDTFEDQDIVCVLCDESWFNFEDELYKVTSFTNGSNLTTNYWLHHWEKLGLNPLANAVAFKHKAQ